MLNNDIPISVVPDNQMPKYGEELPVKDTGQTLASLLSTVRKHQKPVTIPFKPGTPTLQGRQVEEAKRQFDLGYDFEREQYEWKKGLTEREFAYKQQQDAISNQLARAQLNAKAASSKPDTTKYDSKNWAAAAKIAKDNYERKQLAWQDPVNKTVSPYNNGLSPSDSHVLIEIPSAKQFENLDPMEQKRLIDDVYFTNFMIPDLFDAEPPSFYTNKGKIDYYRGIVDDAVNEGFSLQDVARMLVESGMASPVSETGKISLGEIYPGLKYTRPYKSDADLARDFRSTIGR